MMVNKIKIGGIICNVKPTEKVTFFSLCYPNGKDENGKFNNGFMDVKYFGNSKDLPDAKSKVVVEGWLAYSTQTTKDGRTFRSNFIHTKSVKLMKTLDQTGGTIEYRKDSSSETFDDSIPWE